MTAVETPIPTTSPAAAGSPPDVRVAPLDEPGTRLFTSGHVFLGTFLGNPVCGALMIWMNLRAFHRAGGAIFFGVSVASFVALSFLCELLPSQSGLEIVVWFGLQFAWALALSLWSSRQFDRFTNLRMHRRRFIAVVNAWAVGTLLSLLVFVVVFFVYYLVSQPSV